MKIGTVRVSEEFIKPDGTKKWFSHERQYDMDTENPLEVFAKAEATVTTFAKSSSQVILDSSLPPGPPPVITIERTSEDVIIAGMIRAIYACTELNGDGGLISFRNIALGKDETKLAYEVMERKLSKK